MLLDHLIRSLEKRLRNRQSERLGGLEINDEFKSGRLLDWQIGRRGARENPADIGPSLVIHAGDARSIANQAAGRSEFTPKVDRRDRMARRQRHELVAPAGEKRVRADDERAGMELDEACEGGITLIAGCVRRLRKLRAASQNEGQ